MARFQTNGLKSDLILRMADPKEEALLCTTSAFSSWLYYCLSGPVGESLLSLLLFEMNNGFSSLSSVVAHVCLDLLFVYLCNANHCLSLIACNLGNCSDIKILHGGYFSM